MAEKIKGAGKLYVVPTPVGNLGDMAPRAVETLKTVNLILAEDTRTSAVVTRHFGITTPWHPTISSTSMRRCARLWSVFSAER